MPIAKPEMHFFICNSYRVAGEAKGVCNTKGAGDLLAQLDSEILDRGLDAQVSGCGCLKVCTEGPVMVMYPAGKWFGQLTEEKLEAILDAIEDGEDTSEFELE
ncbi:Ferredoxin, 2Fe-2S [Pontiella desulfatans]|uniref:Ferredoxin, 2Fe-2S n=1 Tax=Pontiella desulfatans TaxID=2750659 RepID=A0A6C2U7K5_PONDE|nr:(2Fe-2S) ferredoxin domain-containing protein [Pontiella desulfatans]VGO16030.1 Ferredoxin, 2Fe-2S [Pontiella desulfatans]